MTASDGNERQEFKTKCMDQSNNVGHQECNNFHHTKASLCLKDTSCDVLYFSYCQISLKKIKPTMN